MTNIKNHGFALIEILIVLVILVVLSVVSLKYYKGFGNTQELKVIEEQKQTAPNLVNKETTVFTPIDLAKNSSRQNDMSSLVSAIKFYQVDSQGLPAGITSEWKLLGTATTGCDIDCFGVKITQISCLDLTVALQGYLGKIPFDPAGSAEKTLYAIQKRDNDLFEIMSCQSGINIVN